MKVADVIAKFLNSKVEHCFGVQGGAVVHLFDACARLGPKPIYTHHEQAAAFAACAYSRIRGYGVCIVTTGPGGTNALTGLLAAWQDSIPMMFLSGNTRYEHLSYGKRVRQVGTQEAPIASIVRPICKAAYILASADMADEILKVAYQTSVTGRTGPVWVDCPMDVVWSEIDG